MVLATTMELYRRSRKVILRRPTRPPLTLRADSKTLNELGVLLAKSGRWRLKHTPLRACLEIWVLR